MRKDHLAFAGEGGNSSGNLVKASYRDPFETSDGYELNVEVFGTESSEPLLLFVHGVCESAETWTVQTMVQYARKNQWRLAAVELMGHGLSSGKRAVCSDFDQLRRHVLEFVHHMALKDDSAQPKFVLAGASLGGVLAAYVAHDLSTTTSSTENFLGALLCSPAVGVNPAEVPGKLVVGALRALSAVAGGMQTRFTPMEDPSNYECPSGSTRNFRGHWPLGTSRMLLDVTSNLIPKALATGSLTMAQVPAVFIISGEKDEVVPFEDQVKFYESLKCPTKEFLPVALAGHGFCMLPTEVSSVIHEKMFTWLNARLEKTGSTDASGKSE